MADASIYRDIEARTGGDIYIGVVGPVRTGKSTFIKKFMDVLVLPNIKEQYIKDGIREIENSKYFKNIKISDFFYSTPYGGVEQDNFVNGVLEVETILEPYELLDFLHEVEKKANRERLQHWGPRTLDLDIVLFDDEIIDEKELTVPHKDMKNRDFVLVPLAQLAGYKRHPVLGITIDEMVQNLKELHIV